MKYSLHYEDPGSLEVDLTFEAIIAPNPHPQGVAPFFKGTHFDQPGHVSGDVVLNGERIHVDCYATRDRSWGPRPMGRPKRRTEHAAALTAFGGVGYAFGAAGPDDAWLVYSTPGRDSDPVSCGFLWRDGLYGHILAGERRLGFDPTTGWPIHMEIDAIDDHGRALAIAGDALSRHWRGHGGDTLFHWTWDDVEGFGEDQSYFTRAVIDHHRTSAAASDSGN